MDLIIDANILISAIIATKGKTCELLFSEKLNLFAPELLLKEFYEHKEEILRKSQLSEEELESALSIIFSRIKFVSFTEFESFISKAENICPDPKDTEYFALALKFDYAIWSNDKELKKQDFIKVISTPELLDTLISLK